MDRRFAHIAWSRAGDQEKPLRGMHGVYWAGRVMQQGLAYMQSF
jgi:hypothetical protein